MDEPFDILRDPARLAALRQTGLLDALPAEGFDRITRLGAALLQVPASFISLVDEHRDFYLSHFGLGEPLATSRELRGQTFCHFTITGDEPLVIADTRAVPKYRDVPTVKSLGVSAYLGIPLKLKEGAIIGSFCAIAPSPRQWTASDIQLAKDLAAIAMTEIDLRRRVLSEGREAVRRTALLNSAIDGIYEVDRDGLCTFINAAGAAALGYRPHELIGASMHSRIHYAHPDLQPYPITECPIRQCGERGLASRIDDDVFWKKDGTALPVEYSCAPIRIEGEAVGAVVTFRDIGERRRTEESLKASERKYRQLFVGLPVGLFQTSSEGEFLDGNPELLRILGFADLESLKAADATSLYVDPGARANWQREIAEYGVVRDREIRLRKPSGGLVWVLLSLRAVMADAGQISHYEGIVRDITVLKQTADALAESQETTRQIIESAPDAFIATDDEGKIVQWNSSAERTFGWSSDEAIGKSLSETIIPPQHRVAHEAGLKRIREGGSRKMVGRRLELTALHRGGQEFPVELAITAIERDPLIITSFLRDITERTKLAEHVRQSQKMEAMGSLAGGIAHDFNNLLTVIRVNSELLLEGLTDEKKADLTEVLNATDRATALTQQLLAYSRKQFLEPQPTNLNGVVGSIETMLRRLIPEDIEFVVMLDPSLALVNVDRGQIEQVVTNLVINARDALKDGGRIIVQTRDLRTFPWTAEGAEAPSGHHVLLTVSDNGHGMPKEVIERAFEPFFTTKPEGQGTGLGLSMVYGIVTQSGGEIRLLSETGLGTTVQMFFPVVEVGSGDKSGSVDAELVPRGSERVLLVEDQPSVRKVARRLLEGLGYSVVEAADGEDALHGFERRARDIDLLLTDLVMPKMGGRELARRFRVIAPAMKVLFMSGYSTENAASSTFEPLVHRLLKKPFTREALARSVRAALDTA